MRAGRHASLGLLLALLCVLGLGARCGEEDDSGAAASATGTSSAVPRLAGNLTVLAAASLSEAFDELGGAFEARYPGTKVTFSFDASSALALQANNGAPADLFASADHANMKKVSDAGNATRPRVIASNKLAIIVARNNPKKITGLADLDRSSVSYVLCAPEVPCGRYGAEALRKAGVKARPKSLETNVKAVVTKVSGGEVDAGIGYVTDARAAAPSAEGVEISDEYNVVAEYPMAVLKQSDNRDLADAFVEFILGSDSQAVLAKYGFTAV